MEDTKTISLEDELQLLLDESFDDKLPKKLPKNIDNVSFSIPLENIDLIKKEIIEKLQPTQDILEKFENILIGKNLSQLHASIQEKIINLYNACIKDKNNIDLNGIFPEDDEY